MKYFIIVVLLLFSVSDMMAQERGNGRGGNPGNRRERPKIVLKGTIIDASTNQGLEFATISIFSKKDTSILGGGLSGVGGLFEFESKMGRMFAEIEFIGYDKVTIEEIEVDRDAIRAGNRIIDMGTINMNTSAQNLDEVTIRAEKSENQFTLDKRVFNVGKDLANRGGTAEELLDNVPSVTVDIDGTVNLRGSTGVRILINGQPSRLASSENGLKSIPADMIESIEVITNPSARYEAEGMAGIINIILKKEERSGFNGSFNSSLSYPLGAGIGANLNYRKNKINWFAGYNLNKRTSPGYGKLYQEVYQGSKTLVSEQYRDMDRNSLSNTFRGGMEYFISDKSSIVGSVQYRISDDNNITTLTYEDYILASSEPALFTVREDNESEDESGLQYNIDYNHEFSSRDHKLSVSLQYEDDLETESSEFQEEIIGFDDFLSQRSKNDEGQKNYIFKADYSQPLGSKDHKYEIGWRSSIRSIDNDFQVDSLDVNNLWVSLAGFTNDFNYDEDIHAVYAQYGNKFGRFGFQVGLRAEYAIINTKLENTNEVNRRDSLNFFPSVFLNYEIDEGSALQMSYSRRIRRPRFWDLNPFFSLSDPRNFYSGNPMLRPEYTDSYEINYLQYWENLTLSGGVFYRYSTDVISRIRRIQENDFFVIKPENLGVQDDYGLEVNGSYSGLEWLRLSGNMNFFRSITNSGTDDRSLDADTYAFTSRLTSMFSFLESDLQLRLNYRSPRNTPQGSRKSITSLDIGWSKDFLKKKNLTLTFGVRDLFNDRKRRYDSFGENFFAEGEFQRRPRTFTLSANYRINQKKQRERGERGGDGSDGGEF